MDPFYTAWNARCRVQTTAAAANKPACNELVRDLLNAVVRRFHCQQHVLLRDSSLGVADVIESAPARGDSSGMEQLRTQLDQLRGLLVTRPGRHVDQQS